MTKVSEQIENVTLNDAGPIIDDTKTYGSAKGWLTYRILLVGFLVSFLGSRLASFGLAVWYYQQNNQVSQFAMIALAAILPGLLIGPWAGAWVDRFPRKRILIISQLLLFSAAVVLYQLFLAEQLKLEFILPLVAMVSISQSFSGPALSASVTLMVPKDKLGKASGLRQLGIGVIRLFAPMIAGWLLLQVELKGIFPITLATMLVGLFTLLACQIPDPKKSAQPKSKSRSWQDITQAWRYLKQRPGLLHVLLVVAFVNFNLAAVSLLFVPMVLSFANEAELGTIMSASGIGLIIGGGLMSIWKGPTKKMPMFLIASISISALLCLIPMVTNSWLFALGTIGVMICFPMINTSSQVLWQTKIDPEYQGRVFAFRQSLVGSMMPLSVIVYSWLADKVFYPALLENGAWVNVWNGWLSGLFGVGEGRGLALLASMLGLISLVTLLVASLNPRIRKLEQEIPDYDTPAHDKRAA
ncbi:MFS transporter [Pelagibaculum spongiae]|nr:MFS transporter [Pelagibaculum spongiae]